MQQEEKSGLSLLSFSNYMFKNSRQLQKKIYPENLSYEYGYVISYLCDNDGRDIYQRDIEKEFCLGRSTVSAALKELEREGLVERKAVAADARLKKVTATEGAKMINSACEHELEVFMQNLLSGIDEQDAQTFSRVLGTLRNRAASEVAISNDGSAD